MIFHWYTGAVPPLTGTAVKVTCVPVQNGFVGVEIVTLAGKALLTFIVIEFDVAGLPLAQVALEVSEQEITSPFSGV